MNDEKKQVIWQQWRGGAPSKICATTEHHKLTSIYPIADISTVPEPIR
jgi:hypothetical protein